MTMKTGAFGPFRFSFLLLIFALSTTLTACKKESNFFSDSNASDGSGGGSGTASTGMSLRVKAKTGVSSFLHKFGDVASECVIPLADKDNPQTIQCMLNMMEYDLWFYGFEYEINIPDGFCTFLEEDPYRFYRGEPGTAPGAATMTTLDGAIQSCTFQGTAGTVAGGRCSGQEGYLLPSGTFRCNYSHEAEDGGVSGPNCCEGKTTLLLTTRTTIYDDTGAAIRVDAKDSTVETIQGGKQANCIESPHDYDDSWPRGTTLKSASAISELGGNSMIRSYKVPSVMKLRMDNKRTNYPGVFLNAGMHDWTAYTADPDTWDTSRAIPRALFPIFDRGPTGDHATLASVIPFGFDGSYGFRCLGPAGELRHYIRLYVNEWNTIEDYEEFKANGDASAVNPSRQGAAGVDCSAVNNGNTCNSFWGFTDIIESDAGGDATQWVFPNEWERAGP